MKAPAIGRLGQEAAVQADWRTFVLSPKQEAFVDAYVESMARTGFTEHGSSIRSRARVFCGLVGDPEDWEAMPLAERLAMRKDMRRVVTWCYLTQHISGGADYLVAAQLHVGRFAATLEADFHAKFTRDGQDRGPQRLPQPNQPGELGGVAVELPREGRRAEGRATGSDHG